MLRAIALTRADNTVPDLVDAVDFTLDPSAVPVVDRHSAVVFYPVAETLKTIGDRTVIKEILSAAAEGRDDKALRIYACILVDIVGKDAARVIVERGKIGRVPERQRGIVRLLKMIDEQALLETSPRPRR